MPLTGGSSASWSTLGLAVLPGGRRSGHGSLLALAGARRVAGGVSGVALGGRALALGRGALGRGVSLGGGGLGRGVSLGGGGLGRVLLGRTLIPGRTRLLGGVRRGRARLCRRCRGRRGVGRLPPGPRPLVPLV